MQVDKHRLETGRHKCEGGKREAPRPPHSADNRYHGFIHCQDGTLPHQTRHATMAMSIALNLVIRASPG